MFAPFQFLKGGFVMEINRKKVYLSIILVLFILFSLLFIPCCKVFAWDYDDVKEYLTTNYAITGNRFDERLEEPSLFFLVEPGGTFWANGTYKQGDHNGYGFYIHKDEPEKVHVSVTERDLNLTDYYYEYEWSPYYQTGFTYGFSYIGAAFEFDNTLPVLVVKRNAYKYDGYEESSGLSLIYGAPTLDISIDMDRSSKEANVPGSIIGNVTGSFFDQLEEPGGRLTLSLNKVVGIKYSFIENIIDEVIVEEDIIDGSFNFEFSCPALELGHYILLAHYETENEEFADLLTFKIDRDINDIDKFINIDGQEYKTDDYFGKVFWFTYPEHNKLYYGGNEGQEIFYLRGSEDYFSQNIFGKYSFNENFPIASEGEFDLNINVFINDYLLEECDVSNKLVFTNNISASLLNRGRNTAYITSSTFRDEWDEIYNYKIGDKYYYLYDALDFYYKTTEGSGDVEVTVPDRESGGRDGDPWSGPGSGGIGSGVGGPGGLSIGSPPNRSDYPDDVLGTLNYIIDWIAYIISIPINLLISAFDWLVNVFTSLFYWVGQLSSIIGSWFNFLPIEVRALLMAAFVASIVAFVLRLFRK